MQPPPQNAFLLRTERNRVGAGRASGTLEADPLREASDTPTQHWCSFEPAMQPGAEGRALVSGGELVRASAQADPV
jgi:hypothetical protein